MQTIIARSLLSLKKNLNNIKKNKKIGLVPTMGCIHAGHLALIKKCRKSKYFTVVTIFVNPIQFNNIDDLKKYPSQENKDLEILRKNNVDLVFIPKVQQIYPPGYSTYINEINNSNILCGQHRKNHFSGVLTIVLKLFLIIRPYAAFFGEKDFQQLFLIKKMTKDLNLEVKIIGIPTVRDTNGLALSSRNQLLSRGDLQAAKKIHSTLKKLKHLDYKYAKNLERNLIKYFIKSGLKNIEYLEVREEASMKKINTINNRKKLRIFIAVNFRNVRLIDNLELV